MNIKIKYIFIFMLLWGGNILANESTTKPYQFILFNNATTTGGPNDLGPTGSLNFIYTDPSDAYKINILWELYVNGSITDGVVSRSNINNTRIDALRISYIQGDAFKYGLGVEILGNLGGEFMQNKLHKLIGDTPIPANYPHSTKVTPTINLEYTNDFFNENLTIFSSLRLPLLPKYGVLDFQLQASHTFKNLYQTNVSTMLGVNMDCKKYPDLAVFNGYPMRDFQVCTPETLLSLDYKDLTVFWEMPLMNTDVQNSYFGLKYNF